MGKKGNKEVYLYREREEEVCPFTWGSVLESDKLAVFISEERGREREREPQKQIFVISGRLQVSMLHMQMFQFDSPTANPNDPTSTCTSQPFSSSYTCIYIKKKKMFTIFLVERH